MTSLEHMKAKAREDMNDAIGGLYCDWKCPLFECKHIYFVLDAIVEATYNARTQEVVDFIHENKYMSDDLAGDWAISVYDVLERFAPDTIPSSFSPKG